MPWTTNRHALSKPRGTLHAANTPCLSIIDSVSQSSLGLVVRTGHFGMDHEGKQLFGFHQPQEFVDQDDELAFGNRRRWCVVPGW